MQDVEPGIECPELLTSSDFMEYVWDCVERMLDEDAESLDLEGQ